MRAVRLSTRVMAPVPTLVVVAVEAEVVDEGVVPRTFSRPLVTVSTRPSRPVVLRVPARTCLRAEPMTSISSAERAAGIMLSCVVMPVGIMPLLATSWLRTSTT
jgi:hypothetical protein